MLARLAWLCALPLCLCGPARMAHADDGGNVPQAALKYDIDVELDAEHHSLTGREHIHFENTSRAPVSALEFHLYLNAFRDHRSVFMREGGVKLRGRALRTPGSITITALRTAQGEDLARPLAVQAEVEPGDFTQLRVRLPAPIAPGATLDLDIRFQAQLPNLVARAGYAGEFHMLGQWFPKLAKLGDDGQFINFPYHGFGEFFADFADYSVTIRVPQRFSVAASGTCTALDTDADTRTERCTAQAVHDFAWAAYPFFIRHESRVGDVKLQLYGPRGYAAALERQARVLSQALPYFEQRYGSYPYSTLSVVVPPRDAYAASGMEYPTLFTSGGPWWALPMCLPDPMHDVVAVHELAHQWFSGMIASNEQAHPFLDEGLAQWSSLDFLEAFYARPDMLLSRLARHLGPLEILRAGYAARPHTTPSSLMSADHYTASTLAHAVYARPALVLDRISQRRGLAQLTAAVSRYAKAQRFRHPTPRDLYTAFDASLGPGWGTRALPRALEAEGNEPKALTIGATKHNRAPSGWHFTAELWALASSVLGLLGP